MIDHKVKPEKPLKSKENQTIKITMKKVKIIFSLALASFFTNCQVNDDNKDVTTKESEKITLYLVDQNQSITVRDLDEVKQIISTKYGNENEVVQQSIAKIEMLQEELNYSKNLFLDDKEVADKYQKRLENKFGKSNSEYKKATNGILWGGNATDFLSVTTIPLNLSSSKVNKASSWSALSGGIVTLCDKKWFQGDKYVLFSVIPGPTPVVPSDFDNRTDSFF